MGKNFYLAVFWIIDIEKKSLYNLFLQAWYQVLRRYLWKLLFRLLLTESSRAYHHRNTLVDGKPKW